jgi:hypothetical protein
VVTTPHAQFSGSAFDSWPLTAAAWVAFSVAGYRDCINHHSAIVSKFKVEIFQ